MSICGADLFVARATSFLGAASAFAMRLLPVPFSVPLQYRLLMLSAGLSLHHVCGSGRQKGLLSQPLPHHRHTNVPLFSLTHFDWHVLCSPFKTPYKPLFLSALALNTQHTRFPVIVFYRCPALPIIVPLPLSPVAQVPPVGNLWNLGESKNSIRKLADLRDDVEL